MRQIPSVQSRPTTSVNSTSSGSGNGNRPHFFRPPDSYDNEEKAAMEKPINTIDNDDLYKSIAFGTRSKQKVRADLQATSEEENIMVCIFSVLDVNVFELTVS